MTTTPCEVCRGACCESLIVPVSAHKDSVEFFSTRGQVFTVLGIPNKFLEVQARCSHLCDRGTCSIYDTRPNQCRAYAVGSKECRLTVKRRRPEQADQILSLIDALPTQTNTDK